MPLQMILTDFHSMAGPKLLILEDEFDTVAVLQRLFYQLGFVTDDDKELLDSRHFQGVQHPINQWTSVRFTQDLGKIRLHTSALAGCKDHRNGLCHD